MRISRNRQDVLRRQDVRRAAVKAAVAAALFAGMFTGPAVRSAPACQNHDDCVIQKCCPADVCVEKTVVRQSCPHPNITCDFSYWPEDEACGCFDHICQGSKGLYESIKSTEQEAVWLSRDKLDVRSLQRCDQLPEKYIFECTRKVAEQLFPVNVGDAIRACDYLAKKYYRTVKDDLDIYEECYTGLALKLAAKNNYLAYDLCDKAWEHPIHPKDIDYRMFCNREVGRIFAERNLDQALLVCDRTRGYKREFCYQKLAVQMKTASLCEKLAPVNKNDFDMTPDGCYAAMAFQWKDPKICGLVVDDNARKYCLWSIKHGKLKRSPQRP